VRLTSVFAHRVAKRQPPILKAKQKTPFFAEAATQGFADFLDAELIVKLGGLVGDQVFIGQTIYLRLIAD